MIVMGGGALAALLAALASLIAVADGLPKYWRLLTGSGDRDPPATVTPALVNGVTTTIGSEEMAVGEPRPSPAPDAAGPRVEVVANPSPPSQVLTRRRRISSRLDLRAGQQEIMLEGRLGIAVTFAQVAGTPIATLRINSDDGQENHAILSSGESFVVTVDRTRFRISVVQLDLDLEKAIVQVDQLID